MFKPPASDFWRVGIVPRAIQSLDAATLAAARAEIAWLPDPGPWRYLADPFALLRDELLHVFVEAYDYRSKHAVIERHALRVADLAWLGKSTVLARPFHLSYPLVLTQGPDTFMLPESHQAGELALYRASDASLDHWTRETALLPGLPVAEPSLIQHQGRWWLFYTLVGPGRRDMRELHVAWAPTLTGPWQALASNPVREDLRSARPGGTPFVGVDGCVHLPVQDCGDTYGGALRLLRFRLLTPEAVAAELLPLRLHGGLVSDDHTEGLHTLSACGSRFTLLDVKRIAHDPGRRWLDWQRRARRWGRRLGFSASP
jgi:hypothetical protein